MKWIRRNNTQRIIDAVNKRPVILLTGVRQVGKSSLLKKLFNNAEYVTLDKTLLANEAQSNPTSFLDRYKGQVIIDEVQNAPALFRDLKIRVDEDRQTNGRWLLTGSQQFSMMEQISESLAGRVRIIHLGSLSASELNQSRLLKDKSDLLWKGGFPEIWASKLDAPEFFDDYIQTYLERDLKQLLNVTDLRDFRRFLSLLALRVGQLVNYSEISKEVGVAVNTIKTWVQTLEVSGLIMLLPPYYKNLGKRLIKSPKVYFCDNGLVANLLNITSKKSFQNSPHSGNLWENFVFTEFIKEGFRAGKNIFYFRDQNGVEIDFILEHEGKTHLVEAKYAERPNPSKLNFKKVAPLFKDEVDCVLACDAQEKGVFKLKDYSVYNPGFQFLF
ncbi:MAG: ATP-binding protein [Cyclobacteriaceae bacterium]